MFDCSLLFSVLSSGDAGGAEKGLIYLCVSVSLLWVLAFGYMIRLDKQIGDIRRRLDVRQKHSEDG